MGRDVRGALALYYQYDIHRGARRVKHTRPKLAKSFLKAYGQMLYLKMAGPAAQTIVDTGNTSRSVTSWTPCDCDTASGTTTEGLVVGTGTNAVALTDYALQTKIAHGTGAGQLQYGASVVNSHSSDATSTSIVLTRVFSNASSGSITINEIGVYATMSGTSSWQFCIVRDLATIAMAVGDQLTLNYILKTVV